MTVTMGWLDMLQYIEQTGILKQYLKLQHAAHSKDT